MEFKGRVLILPIHIDANAMSSSRCDEHVDATPDVTVRAFLCGRGRVEERGEWWWQCLLATDHGPGS